MSGILLSVAMTTYNHEKYIRRALESVVSQKVNFAYEVIVGEDCSTDSTRAIVEEFADKYPDLIKPIYREKNTGGKLNGFDVKCRCRGKYMAFLEGDDYWTSPDKLQKQVDFLEENPEYIAVVHKYELVDAQGDRINGRSFGYYEKGGDYTLDDFMKSEIPSQLATFVIRNIYLKDAERYREYSFKENTIQGDIKLTFFLTAQGKIYRMEDTMSAYRQVKTGGDNWTARDRRNPKFFNKWKQLCDLERYAKQEWGIDLDMKFQKKAYSARAILNVLRCRDRSVLNEAVNILKYEKKAIPYLFSYVVQKYILRKI